MIENKVVSSVENIENRILSQYPFDEGLLDIGDRR